MAIGIHVAHTRFVGVDSVNAVVDKSKTSTPIHKVQISDHQHRLIVDPAIPNTADQPTVDAYLKAEADDDYVLQHIDQTTIVTYKRTAAGGFTT